MVLRPMFVRIFTVHVTPNSFTIRNQLDLQSILFGINFWLRSLVRLNWMWIHQLVVRRDAKLWRIKMTYLLCPHLVTQQKTKSRNSQQNFYISIQRILKFIDRQTNFFVAHFLIQINLILCQCAILFCMTSTEILNCHGWIRKVFLYAIAWYNTKACI